jgi:hypothetical protein
MKQIRAKLFGICLKHLSFLVFGALAALTLAFAQSPTVLNRTNWPKDYGGPYEVYYQAVPTALTALDTRDVRLLGVCVSNSTAGALTFTIQTKDASPLPLPFTGSIAANSAVCNNTPFGLLSKGGFSVQASGAGLYYQVVWTH